MKGEWNIFRFFIIVIVTGLLFFSCPDSAKEPPVNELPVITITTQPAPVTNVTAGSISGNLTVAATVTQNATLSYRWYSNTSDNNEIGKAFAIGVASASFAIPARLAAGTYFYFCEVYATGGAAVVYTNVSTVNVAIQPVITISTQPVPTTNVIAGNISGSLTVTASVTSSATLCYQWQQSNQNDFGGLTNVGTNSQTIAIPTCLTPGTYYFRCVVSADGMESNTSNTARVNVAIFFPIEMVSVLGGSFQLGKELNTVNGHFGWTPDSTVTLTSFYMGKYQVTQAQYQAIMGTNPSYFIHFLTDEGEIEANRPVERVSWYDTIVFCNKLSAMESLSPAYEMQTQANTSVWSTDPATWGSVPVTNDTRWNAVRIAAGSTGYRLPTEAQWEYTAKGGDGSPGNYTYAGSNNADEVAWYSGNSNSMTHLVGKKKANGLGIYDMSGNVLEWCWDWYGDYTSTAKMDPVGATSGSGRVGRGGCWYSDVSSVGRFVDNPYYRSNCNGFRVSLP